jgi:glycerol-3-phosphate acyltransferase PlsY
MHIDLLLILLGYLSGSLPFAIWVTRWVKGVDVRQAGSGHATATNTIRQAGWVAGVLVLILDIAKGFIPVYLAGLWGSNAWVAPLTAGLVVVGHCWPVFAGFRGGMGLAATAGTILAISPLGFLIALGVLVALVLVIHHSARASVLAGLMIPWVFKLLDFPQSLFWISLAAGLVVAVRFLDDWNRRYRELWLDRDRSKSL